MVKLNDTLGSDHIAPSGRLPLIKALPSLSLSDLRDTVNYLRVLYNPEVRGSRRRKSGSTANQNDVHSDLESSLDAIRADSFERTHAMRWLTTLLMRSDMLTLSEKEDETSREGLVGEAAALLAACAGAASSGRLIRKFSFNLSPTNEEIILQLMDVPLDNNDYASVGAQTWGAAVVMADMLLESPSSYGLPEGLPKDHKDGNGRTFRVLELGAGTGLVGLAVAKVLERTRTPAEIILTDVHPAVLTNLKTNSVSNFPPGKGSSVKVSVVNLDWEEMATSDTRQGDDALFEQFDMIIGADIIYEAAHAKWIKECLRKLLLPEAFFHLVIPLRSTHTNESGTIGTVFGQSSDLNEIRIEMVSRERFVCDAYHGGRAGEVEYEYYKIGSRNVLFS